MMMKKNIEECIIDFLKEKSHLTSQSQTVIAAPINPTVAIAAPTNIPPDAVAPVVLDFQSIK